MVNDLMGIFKKYSWLYSFWKARKWLNFLIKFGIDICIYLISQRHPDERIWKINFVYKIYWALFGNFYQILLMHSCILCFFSCFIIDWTKWLCIVIVFFIVQHSMTLKFNFSIVLRPLAHFPWMGFDCNWGFFLDKRNG